MFKHSVETRQTKTLSIFLRKSIDLLVVLLIVYIFSKYRIKQKLQTKVVISKARSEYHLNVLDILFIKTLLPNLCKQPFVYKSNVYKLL